MYCKIKRMNIFNKIAIERFMTKHADSAKSLQLWVDTVEKEEWKNHNDLKQIFPSADYIGKLRYIFNIKGNGYRIIAVVVFVEGAITVRFVGTHSEYNKINCLTI